MSIVQRLRRSERELRAAAHDLYYEFWMFAKLANGLASGILGESIINNALLESFCVHAQAILDFLYNDELGDHELSALDFVPDPAEWIRARPGKSAVLKEMEADLRHRVAKEIGRLTYNRHVGAPERNPWPFMRIAKEVSAALDAFLEITPEHLLGPRWQEVKQQRKSPNGAGM
jgi:hypothetical protein